MSPGLGERTRFGILDEDEDGRIICHECERSFHALAIHLARAHEMTTAEYRTAHGLRRTQSLVSTTSTRIRQDIGRRRRDEDPRVLQALSGAGATLARAAPFPARIRRPATDVAVRDAARARAQRRWTQALTDAGWSTWQDAEQWALAQGLGWSAVAERLGTSATPTRRAGEAAGVHLPKLAPGHATTARMLSALRQHAQRPAPACR